MSARGIMDAAYDMTVPFYYETSSGQSVYVGIRNRSAMVNTFNLNMLRVEKFA